MNRKGGPGETRTTGERIEVVEFALNRTLCPAVVAEYETKLVPRELLRRKLHEWSHQLERDAGAGGDITE